MGGSLLMNISKKLFFIFLLHTLLLANAMSQEESFENNFNIKAGLSASRVFFNSSLISAEEDSSDTTGFGIGTSAGYKWNNWELLVASDILFGKLEDLTFQVDASKVRGDGSFRIFSLSPMIRYFTFYALYNRWNFYVAAGPTWSLHTFIITNDLGESNFSSKKRISFENRGGSLNVGLEEVVPFKETHPAFFEIGYSYMRSKRIFVVDASDFKDVKTLSKGESKGFYGHYFVARLGITLF